MSKDDDEPAMQFRCVHCLREQYMLAVPGVSDGQHPCVWCGQLSARMTDQQYRDALAEARAGERTL